MVAALAASGDEAIKSNFGIIISITGAAINLVYLNSDYSADESSNSSDDLSSKLKDTEKDPSWFPNNFELKKVAVIDNSDVHHALFPDKKKSPNKKRLSNS